MAKAPAKKKDEGGDGKPSAMSGIIGVVVATLLAAGGGVGFGLKVLPGLAGDAKPPEQAAAKTPEKSLAVDQIRVRQLAPIITNLAQPRETWIRLEASVVLETEDLKELNVLIAKISEDSTAYVRTLTLAHLEGATALQHLKEDLSDRARIRSEGKIKEVIITGLVAE
jgi:flagellar FliL protein